MAAFGYIYEDDKDTKLRKITGKKSSIDAKNVTHTNLKCLEKKQGGGRGGRQFNHTDHSKSLT